MNDTYARARNPEELLEHAASAMRAATPTALKATIWLWDSRIVEGVLDPVDIYHEGLLDCSGGHGFVPANRMFESLLGYGGKPFRLRLNNITVRWSVYATPLHLAGEVVRLSNGEFGCDLLEVVTGLSIAECAIRQENKWTAWLMVNSAINESRIHDFGVAAAGRTAGWRLGTGDEVNARFRFNDESSPICNIGENLRREIKFLAKVAGMIANLEPS